MSKQVHNAFVRGLKIVMAAEGWKMKPLSEAAGLGETAVRDLFRYSSAPRVTKAYAIAQVLGRSVDELIETGQSDGEIVSSRHTVPIVGKVGAGAHVPVFEPYEPGTGPIVELPSGLANSNGIVAVEIEGDSMEPVYSAGDLLFYTRNTADGVPTEAIGRRCVCECERGLGWVKQVRRGSEPGLFNLISLNPSAENQHDVRLKWAAPVLLHWPVELAKRQ